MPLTMPKTFTASEYAQLGAELECDASSAECAAFARKFGTSTDGAMRALACFALFKGEAICLRLAGRIDEAMLAEANADTVYKREIKPENRW